MKHTHHRDERPEESRARMYLPADWDHGWGKHRGSPHTRTPEQSPPAPREEIWIDNYWYADLECAHCKKQTKHRVKGHCFGLEELKNVVVYLLLPMKVMQIQISRLEQAGKYGVSCEQGAVNIATCTACGSRSLNIEKDRRRDYFFHELRVACKGCGKKLEQNNIEKVAYCFDDSCPIRNGDPYRCPECGDARVSYISGGDASCHSCGARFSFRVRTAC